MHINVHCILSLAKKLKEQKNIEDMIEY